MATEEKVSSEEPVVEEEAKEEQATTSDQREKEDKSDEEVKKEGSSEEKDTSTTNNTKSDKYDELVASVAAGGGAAQKEGPSGPSVASQPPPQQHHHQQHPHQHQHHHGPPLPPHGMPPQHAQYPPHMNVPPDWRGPPPPQFAHQYPPYALPPPQQRGYPPGYPPGAYPPQGYAPPPPQAGMMRAMPPQQQQQQNVGPNGELVRMPPGLTPTEWAAQQQRAKDAASASNGKPATPSSCSNQPIPSPAASSIAEESLDEKPPTSSSTTKPSAAPAAQSVMSPAGAAPGAAPPAPATPGTPMQPASVPPTPHTEVTKVPVGKVFTKQEILDKLVGPVNHMNPAHVMNDRRNFFDRLMDFCERSGDPIQTVPQVSKQCIDLHRLYIGVRNRGGFQQVTKDKMWKMLCVEANPDLSESSAAGYQLRKHYQKHLLLLECVETGKNPEDEVAFADKLKRQRKRDTGGGPAGAPQGPPGQSIAGGQGPPGAVGGGGPPTQQSSQPPNSAANPAAAFAANGNAPPPGQFHPGMDPNYYYQQQQQGMIGPPPHHPGYPPQHMANFSPGQYPGRMPPGQTPMRAPMPQNMAQHEMEEQQRQQQWYAAQQQQMQQAQQAQQAAAAAAAAAANSGSSTQPATPSASNQPPTPADATTAAATTTAATGSQAGSRAPSAGPSATPDSTSRMSGGADTAETAASAATNNETSSSSSSEPSTSANVAAAVTPAQQPPPPQQQQPQQPYYPPGAYPPPPPQMRQPGFAPAPYSQYPQAPPAHPGYHPAAHPSHPQHAQFIAWQQQQQHQRYIQQQQQQQQQQQRYPPNYPRQPQQHPPQVPSPSTAKRYPQPATQQPQPTQQMAIQQQQQVQRGLPIASTSQAVPVVAQAQSQQQSQQQQQYPPGCVEATSASQHVKRRKILSRELYNATPRRLIMALRSGLDAEAVWAINSLTILLYDDTNPQPSLQQMPGLLNVIVEHLYATLALLYPKQFKIDEPGKPRILVDSIGLVNQIVGGKSADLKLFVDRMPVVARKSSDKQTSYTMKSRNGVAVQFRDEKLPRFLSRRVCRENDDDENGLFADESLSTQFVATRNKFGLGGGLAERIYAKLKDQLIMEQLEDRPAFSKFDQDEKDEKKEEEDEKDEEEEEDLSPMAMLRGAKVEELSECKHEKELGWPRPSALCPKNRKVEQLAQRALALANILRGFSFVPGSEHLMSKNEALLYILGRFLKLYVKEKRIVAQKRNICLNPDELRKLPAAETLDEQREKALAVLDDDEAMETMMIETAAQLRDDAFVMLSHMSVSLTLFELPSTISYPIYDGLLHWAVSSVPEATDYTLPIVVSPRDYSLEIMCKMVVVDRNVDMFLSTGKWSRMEKFVNMLSKLLTMNEETHYREFAIVILNALCVLNEAVCYLCAIETNSINHLILFIDSADQNMHQVMQQHGMNALRDNPEMMGTSVGMLRRAASMLKMLVKVPMAYRIFLKHQQRLLQFTMSQLMDSRVAAMVADTLYEVQDLVREFGEVVPESCSKKTKTTSQKSADIEPTTNGQNGIVEKVEKEEKKEEVTKEDDDDDEDDGGESNDTESYSSFKLKHNNSYKRNSNAIIDEKSRSPPPKRACLTNGFDKKSKTSNGSLNEPSSTTQQQSHDGAMTTAVA